MFWILIRSASNKLPQRIPAGTWRLYNVVSTSMQRNDVASMLRRSCIDVMCLLGCFHREIRQILFWYRTYLELWWWWWWWWWCSVSSQATQRGLRIYRKIGSFCALALSRLVSQMPKIFCLSMVHELYCRRSNHFSGQHIQYHKGPS